MFRPRAGSAIAFAIAAGIAIAASGCGDDALHRLGDDGGANTPPNETLDSGVPGSPDAATREDAGARDDAGTREDGSIRLLWLRAPSSAGRVRAPGGEHAARLRLPPPSSHGESSSPEHHLSSVLGSARLGGQR